jgi:hypothetical protein
MACGYGSGMGRHGLSRLDNSPARPPEHAIRAYPFRALPASIPRVPDERTLGESHPPTDDNAVNEWAEILAAEAPSPNDRQIARLRRLFMRHAGMSG